MDMSYQDAGSFAWAYCNAYMAHPKDEKKRSEFLYWVLAKMQVDVGEAETPMSLEQLRALISGAERGVGDDLTKACTPGMMAGDVLLYVLQMNAAGISDGGIDKACHLTSTFYTATGASRYDGKTYKAGRDTVLNNWNKFKSVAHLWAGYLITWRGVPPSLSKTAVIEYLFEQQATTLATSHKILEMACSIRLPRTETSLLPRENCW